MSDTHTWDNAADLKQLSMDQTRRKDDTHHQEAIFSQGNTFSIIAISHKRLLQWTPEEL